MTVPGPWSRRRVLGVSLAAGLSHIPAEAQEADRGLGGTGAAPAGPEDRGIGGTGVIGTIRGFGSILVNGLRVTFPRSVEVRIDGRPARLRDLAIGHVVRVLAQDRGGHLATRHIEAVSEVSGPIQAPTPEGFSVLGQAVIVPGAARHRWGAHRWVAVSGLRRLDGAIVASLIEPRPPGEARVSGVARADADADAEVRVGALGVEGLPEALLGQRLHMSGRLVAGRLVVTRAQPLWLDLLARRPDRLSVEDYVALHVDGTRFASGLPSTAPSSLSGSADEVHAVVSATVTPDGRVQVTRVQPETGSRGSVAGSGRVRGGMPQGEPRGEPPGRPHGFGPGAGAGPNGGRNGGPGPGGGGPGGDGFGGGASGGPGRGGGSHP